MRALLNDARPPASLLTMRRSQFLSLALAAPLALSLTACGGGSDDGAAPRLRVLNLSDVPSLDLYEDDDRSVSSIAQGQLGDYRDVSTDELDYALRRAGGDLDLASSTRQFSKDSHYTLLAYGRESALGFVTLGEDEDADELDSGKAGIRVFNASQDVGELDVYLTSSEADLSETVPTHARLGSGTLSGFRELSSGSYRLRVTGAGDDLDLRLDLPQLTLKSKTYTTVVLTSGSGGVLVHAGNLEQQGSYTAMRNTKTRLRVVAGAAGRGVVTTSWQGRSISAGLVSPSVGPYTLLEAGSAALDVRLAGSLVSSATRNLVAGADYTLLVHGSGATSLIADDNRLPASGSSRARIRLVHGAPTADLLTLAVDYAVTAADVAQGSASGFVSIASGEERRLDVTAASAADAIYSAEDTRIQAGAVYTVFALGGNATPTGLLRKDR